MSLNRISLIEHVRYKQHWLTEALFKIERFIYIAVQCTGFLHLGFKQITETYCKDGRVYLSFLLTLMNVHKQICEPGSSVGIGTDYGLDGPGSNYGGDEIFRPSRPALGPTQHPVEWIPGLSRG